MTGWKNSGGAGGGLVRAQAPEFVGGQWGGIMARPDSQWGGSMTRYVSDGGRAGMALAPAGLCCPDDLPLNPWQTVAEQEYSCLCMVKS